MFLFLNIHRSGVLTALAWLVPHETAAVSAQVLCTPYNHAPCYFMQSHIRKVYACLAVTCHLHFWQNDRDLLRATAVTRGWNRYRNKEERRGRRWKGERGGGMREVCVCGGGGGGGGDGESVCVCVAGGGGGGEQKGWSEVGLEPSATLPWVV